MPFLFAFLRCPACRQVWKIRARHSAMVRTVARSLPSCPLCKELIGADSSFSVVEIIGTLTEKEQQEEEAFKDFIHGLDNPEKDERLENLERFIYGLDE